jgi:hypothetical protein
VGAIIAFLAPVGVGSQPGPRPFQKPCQAQLAKRLIFRTSRDLFRAFRKDLFFVRRYFAWTPGRDSDRPILNVTCQRFYDRCPRCGTNDWLVELAAVLMGPLPAKSAGVNLGSFAPVLALTCKNCASMFHHNLITLGLWP